MPSVQTITSAVATTNAAAEPDTEVITGLVSFADGRTSRSYTKFSCSGLTCCDNTGAYSGSSPQSSATLSTANNATVSSARCADLQDRVTCYGPRPNKVAATRACECADSH